MKKYLVAFAVGCLLGLLACTPRVMALGGQRLEPEGWYRTLFEEMEKCSGYKRSYRKLEFYVVAPGALDPYDADAIWSPDHRMYVETPNEFHAPLFAHEFLHYLSKLTHRPDGTPGPFEEVLARCGLGGG